MSAKIKANRVWALALASASLACPAWGETFDRGALEELVGEPVTLSATGAPQRVTDAPVNMTIITQDEIRRSGAIDLPGVLERLAQLDVNRYASAQAEVAVRGYNQAYSPRLLVLVNGRQVYLDHYAFTNWNLIPVQLAEIRQIEVVAGPNTALFGFNAVAGVVNIITFDPLRDDVDAASVTAGSDAYRDGSFAITHAFSDAFSARLSGGLAEGDGWPGERAAAAANGQQTPGVDNGALNLHLGAQFTPRLRAEFEASASRDHRLEAVPDASMSSTDYGATAVRGALATETDIGLFEGQAYFNTLDASLSAAVGQFQFNNRVFVASGSWLNRLAPAHAVRVALEYRHNWMELNGGPAGVDRAGLSYDVYSVAGMWNWTISDHLASTVAVRLDRLELKREGPPTSPNIASVNSAFDTVMDEPSFNAGLVWRPTEVDSVRLSAARGVQSPSMVEYGLEFDLGPVVVTGAPNLEPTIVKNVELGWDRNVPAINSRLRASIYWQSNDNLKYIIADLSITPGGLPDFGAANFGSSQLTGIDLALEGASGAVNWRLAYSHRDINDTFNTLPIQVPLDFEGMSPSDVATAGLGWTHGAFAIDAELRHVSETQQFTGNLFAGYTLEPVNAHMLANARLAWNASDHVTLAVYGRNLLDDETQTTLGAPMPRSLFVTLSSRF